jgi:hypothetical protein
MSLKLFRATGYHSILDPGEARLAPHPAWAVAGVAVWIGLADNVWLWRALAGAGPSPLEALLAGVGVAGAVGTLLSVLCWRRTFKPAATLLLLAGALLAGGVWVHGPQLQAAFSGALPALLPPWTALMRWQVPTALVVLGVIPVLVLWNGTLRRLPGTDQLEANVWGAMGYALLALAGFFGMSRLPS